MQKTKQQKEKIMNRAKELIPQIVIQTTQEIMDDFYYQRALMRPIALNITDTVSVCFLNKNEGQN